MDVKKKLAQGMKLCMWSLAIGKAHFGRIIQNYLEGERGRGEGRGGKHIASTLGVKGNCSQFVL